MISLNYTIIIIQHHTLFTPSHHHIHAQSPMNHYHHDLYSPILTTPSSPIILPMHDEPEYDAYYNTYVEVQQSYAASNTLTCLSPSAVSTTHVPNNTNKTISQLYQQPPKQYHHHQYTKSSPVLLSPTTTKKSRTPTPPTSPSPMSTIVTDLDETPPPLPPPNPNQHHYPTTNYHHNQQQQQSHQLRYQQQKPQQQLPNSHHHMQQQQQQQERPQQDCYNNGETIYGTNSPTVSLVS